jgi:2-polyprenyl-6-methoxyphenol hydroxylase-like FAD-dependent oxidoreductase
MHDVMIVGYGPTGMLAAVLLGRAGRRVAVFERYAQLYNLPRVGIVHDDVLRMFQEVGISDAIAPATFFLPTYELANKGRILLSNDVQPSATHGWPEFISIYQPAFEAELDRVAKSLPTVSVLQGHKAVGIAQDADSVTLTVEDGKGVRAEHGRFLLGCDGGNSFVRGALGIEFEFLGFDQDWLVIDARAKRPRPDLPYLRQFCEPEQPGMTMQMGAHHRRWSFMIFPGEPHEEAVRPENVWRRLARPEGGTPDEFELIRVVTYRFTSQIAPRWRVGRALLAGDAAHLMPPFLAQGMCSGFRDAHNLAWKLDAVLKGLAPAALLDSYAAERMPNARATILESAKVGQNVIERDAAKARERDARLAAMQAELARAKGENKGQQALIAFRVPGLTHGFVARSEGARGAGDALPQAKVRRNGAAGRFDDLAGRGFMILARQDVVLSSSDRAFWQSLGGSIVRLGAGGDAIEDSEGSYTRLMDEYGCDVLVKRPDHYLFGACGMAQLPVMLADLRAQLTAG